MEELAEKNSSIEKMIKRNGLLLLEAIKKNDVVEINKLLGEFPVDYPITDTGLTALAFASLQSTELSVFETILKHKPNLNASNSSRKTALHQAALAGNKVAL